MNRNKKIYFICPLNKKPSGGVKQIFRMAEILDQEGFDSCVVLKKNEKPSWFENNIQIKGNRYIFKKLKFITKQRKDVFSKLILFFLKQISFEFEKDALLVFPEIYGDKFHKFFTNDFVIFNQNCYYTFDNFEKIADHPYCSKRLKAVIVVSEDSRKYLKYVFPHLDVKRIYLGLKSNSFYPSNNKENIISFMPRKLEEDVNQFVKIFQQKNENTNWRLFPIEDKTENEVGEIMRRSSIFLSFNHKEGFGLPPIEAMACGCYVIGYAGQGGKEYFLPQFCTKIPEGDILQFVQSVMEKIEDKPKIIEKGILASKYILNVYNYEAEKSSIIKVWNEILSK